MTTIVLRYDSAPEHLERFRRAFPGFGFVVCPADDGIDAQLPQAAALIGGWSLPERLVAAAPVLRWVQSSGTGVDRFPLAALAARGIALTTFRGVPAPNMADHVLALMLAFARRLPTLMERQVRAEWIVPNEGLPSFELEGQVLGLLGFGEVGRAIARRARGFGMKVWAVRRQAGGADPHVDRLLPPEKLPAMLEAADHLAVTLPLTAATERILGRAAFARMKPGAYLYNVGRREVVDQEALIAALREQRLGGAGLDVVTPEPLPRNSPLWTMPNVIITGHTSGPSPRYWERGMAVLMENLARFRDGRGLSNQVDLAHGY